MKKSNLRLWYERSKYSKKNCAICKNMTVRSSDLAKCEVNDSVILREFSSPLLGNMTKLANKCFEYDEMRDNA